MHPAKTPDELVTLSENLKFKGARGVLISGGCDKNGTLMNIERFLPALKKLHEMGLIIKLHTGFINTDLATKIVETGTDIASMEFVGNAETITEIFGISATPETYLETFINLKKAGIPHIAPHIAVGLHYGKLKGEFTALELMKDNKISPSTIAIIVFRPTKGTKLENLRAPEPYDIGQVVSYARKLFPYTKLILGAMRPRSSMRNDPNKNIRFEIESTAVDEGVDGIEIPSTKIIKKLQNEKFKLKKIEAYGVLPVEYEEKVGYQWL
jgi:uncharacterized radical SAM superfamily protein